MGSVATLRQLARVLAHPSLLAGAVAFALLVSLAAAAGWFGLWLAVILGAGLARHPYALTYSEALGEREPLPASVEDFNPVAHPGHLLHAGLLTAAGLWLSAAQHVATLLLGGAAVLLVAPASIALMAVEDRLTAALDPRAVYRLMRELGAHYVALLVFAGCLALLAGAVASLAHSALISRLVWLYALFGTFAATGRLVHLCRHELSLAVSSVRDEREAAERRLEMQAWDGALDRIYGLVRGGDLPRAEAAIAALMQDPANDLQACEVLYARMREWDVQSHMDTLAQAFLARLVAAEQLQRAMEVAEARLRQDPDFRPAPHLRAAVAAHAGSVGHRATAAAMQAASAGAQAASQRAPPRGQAPPR